ncbi:hypothetical protein Btru_048251 [Bulinus truncatus]|nr:hypothetical protein Btru_048251 [Bulinus truncatus]
MQQKEVISIKTRYETMKELNLSLQHDFDLYRERNSPSFESQVETLRKENLFLQAEKFQLIHDIDKYIEKNVNSFTENLFELCHLAATWNLPLTIAKIAAKDIGINKQLQVRRKIVVVKSSHPELVTELRDKLERKQSPLMAAARNGSCQSLAILLSFGADVNSRDDLGDTALVYACRGRHLEDSSDYVIFGQSQHPFTISDQKSCIEQLIASRADLDNQGKNGMTSLMCCAQNGDWQLLEKLLEYIPNLELKSREHKTALMYACSKNSESHCKCVSMLLKRDCDINAADDKGDTALMFCIDSGNMDAFRLLLSAGADINARNRLGITCLMQAVSKNTSSFAEELLRRQADVSLLDRHRYSALMLAAESDIPCDIIRLLLGSGADVNQQNVNGETALMLASSRLLVDKVKALVSSLTCPADVHVKNKDGATALEIARLSTSGRDSDKQCIVKLLLSLKLKNES